MKHSFKINTMAFAVAGVLAGMIGFSGDANAARKVCDDGSYPPCNTEGETATNNLSRPTIIFSGGGLTGVTCSTDGSWPAIVPPTGVPQTGYSIDDDWTYEAYWFVQGVHKWQAPCKTWSSSDLVPVYGEWGDNLTGDAKLKVGSPIRVELVLSYDLEVDELVDGYVVQKLQPELLDRESKYGTEATPASTEGVATPSLTIPGVYDSTANLRIEKTDGSWTYDQPATAEINAKGIVVYGYNLRVPTAGTYLITYTVPQVDFTGADAGQCADHTCSLIINVGSGGGGGGGRPQRP
jgi:hypothetical protein